MTTKLVDGNGFLESYLQTNIEYESPGITTCPPSLICSVHGVFMLMSFQCSHTSDMMQTFWLVVSTHVSGELVWWRGYSVYFYMSMQDLSHLTIITETIVPTTLSNMAHIYIQSCQVNYKLN